MLSDDLSHQRNCFNMSKHSKPFMDIVILGRGFRGKISHPLSNMLHVDAQRCLVCERKRFLRSGQNRNWAKKFLTDSNSKIFRELKQAVFGQKWLVWPNFMARYTGHICRMSHRKWRELSSRQADPGQAIKSASLYDQI